MKRTRNKELKMSTQVQNHVVNGIDTEALKGAIDGITAQPEAGMTTWAVRSRWVGGTRTEHSVEKAVIGDQTLDRGFKIQIDEPEELCGTNEFANPQEYLMSAINACMMVGYSAVASLMGIELTRLEVELQGDIDLRGFLGIDASVPNGYQSLKQEVYLDGDATPEQLQKLHETVLATSPNFFNVTQAIPMNSTLNVG
jgi:uncharacterized OsmC-like protein